MPATVDEENEEFNYNSRLYTPILDGLAERLRTVAAQLADPLCCADVHQQVYALSQMTEKRVYVWHYFCEERSFSALIEIYMYEVRKNYCSYQ